MSATPVRPPVGVDTVAAWQRGTVRTLVVSQAVGALGMTIGIATASLLARDLTGSDQEAGLAQTSQVLGAALFSLVLARVMGRRGRRVGLSLGYAVAALGAALAVLSGVLESMPVLLVGAMLIGATTSANNASRYAATDLAVEEHRGRDLSTVVWATTIGAVFGPNLTGPAADLARVVGIPELTGPFAVGGLGMLVAAAFVWWRLRPDPLLEARRLAAQQASDAAAEAERAGTAPAEAAEVPTVPEVLRQRPAILAAIAGIAAAHAVMVSVMVMTPLHMEHGGADLEVIGFVISIHVLGMFAFSPLVGMAVDRVGAAPVLALGGVVLLVAMLLSGLSPAGSSVQIFAALFLLGLGWSLATVAAATVVAAQAPLAARTQVQGTADLVMSLAGAVGGGASGVVMHVGSYAVLSAFAAVFAVLVLAAAAFSARSTPRT